MAELDYAFLADHAQVADGKLSVIGASFTHVSVKDEGGLFVLSVAGRVTKNVEEEPPNLAITLRVPGESFELTTEAELVAGPTARPYGDKVGILFTSGLAFPIVHGLYEVFLVLNGEEARRLAFDLEILS